MKAQDRNGSNIYQKTKPEWDKKDRDGRERVREGRENAVMKACKQRSTAEMQTIMAQMDARSSSLIVAVCSELTGEKWSQASSWRNVIFIWSSAIIFSMFLSCPEATVV